MNDSNNKVKVFWLVVAFVFISAGVLSFYITDLKKMSFLKLKEESAKLSEKNTLSTSQARIILEDKANFETKDTRSSQAVSVEGLDREVSMFILSGSSSLEANRLSFTDNTTGWSIKYSINKVLNDAYYELLNLGKTSPYESQLGSRTGAAAIVVTESQNYRVKIIVEKVDEQNSNVEVYVIEA